MKMQGFSRRYDDIRLFTNAREVIRGKFIRVAGHILNPCLPLSVECSIEHLETNNNEDN